MLAFVLLKKKKKKRGAGLDNDITFITVSGEAHFHCRDRFTSKTCMKSLNILFLSASRVTSSKADSFKNLSLT